MAKREFLMLAHKYDKQAVRGWMLSEKLDGMRAFWDGGISRGALAAEVPYANTTKDARYLDVQQATGLWSRYMKPIQAPSWWLDGLPRYPLDGELWMGYGKFEDTMSVCRSLNAGDRWKAIKYMVFDSPPLDVIFAPGKISNPMVDKELTGDAINYAYKHGGFERQLVSRLLTYRDIYTILHGEVEEWPSCGLVVQNRVDSDSEIDDHLNHIVGKGGEGVMLRNPTSFWVPQRSKNLLKYKPFSDAEGIVTGFIAGRETDRGSKLLGKMGAMILDFGGKRLELSGFTDAERQLQYVPDTGRTHIISVEMSAESCAGKELPDDIEAVHFRRGDRVSFKYRELSQTGIPKEARYFRKNPL